MLTTTSPTVLHIYSCLSMKKTKIVFCQVLDQNWPPFSLSDYILRLSIPSLGQFLTLIKEKDCPLVSKSNLISEQTDQMAEMSIFRLLKRRRQWHPTPVLLPGKSHGRRSLVGSSLWGRWGLDMTERLHFHFSLSCIGEGNGNPLQCSCLENPRDRGAWWAPVYGVAQSRTWLKWLSSSSSSTGYRGFNDVMMKNLLFKKQSALLCRNWKPF